MIYFVTEPHNIAPLNQQNFCLIRLQAQQQQQQQQQQRTASLPD
jgi:hypothetical protein